MNPAENINQTLSMRDVAARYGMESNRAGFISCPFHSSDNTPSLKIYNEPGKGFYCYGCNTGGDVIKFVQLLFNLTFPQALIRIKSDFGIQGGTSQRDDYEWQRRKRREKQAKEKHETELLRIADEHCRIILAIKSSEPMSDEWCKAVHSETYYGYLMEEHLYG